MVPRSKREGDQQEGGCDPLLSSPKRGNTGRKKKTSPSWHLNEKREQKIKRLQRVVGHVVESIKVLLADPSWPTGPAHVIYNGAVFFLNVTEETLEQDGTSNAS